MSKRWLTACELVERGNYTSIWAVHRAVKRGELPEGSWQGNRKTWDPEQIDASARERAGRPRSPRSVPLVIKPKPVTIKRSRKS